MQDSRTPIRTEEVRPPSPFDEAGAVFLGAMFVVLCVIYTVAFEVYGTAARTTSVGLLPFQVLFADLPSDDQRTYRQMREGFGEALRQYGRDGAWPASERLARDRVAPFVADPLDRAKLRWQLELDDAGASYVGLPTAPGEFASYQVRIRAPDPRAIERLDAKTALDEEHRSLPDGTLLHVTYWRRDRPPPGGRGGGDPARDGWQQIRLKSLFDEGGME